MRSINGGKGRGGPPPRQDAIAVRPIGDVGDPQRAQIAARLLAELVGLMGARGARPEAGLLALTYKDGSMTFLVAANGADQAGDVQGRVYQELHATVTAYNAAPPPSGTNVADASSVTDPAPPPDPDDTGPQGVVDPVVRPEGVEDRRGRIDYDKFGDAKEKIDFDEPAMPAVPTQCSVCSRPVDPADETCGSCGASLKGAETSEGPESSDP